MDIAQFAEVVRLRLQADGYQMYRREPADGCEPAGAFWFTWKTPGTCEAELGPTVGTEWAAWASAFAHRLSLPANVLGSEPSPWPDMGPFYPACLPDSAFDADLLAARHGISREVALQQVEKLRRQSVYMNERYQVNVEVVAAPFGLDTGDVLWLSVKRRDRAAIHDWRELQSIKNRLVGDEHEAFEVYPAESRLVDTANQYHLWVFSDPKVRLPVGFRTREVLDAPAAAAQGAGQRPFAKTPVATAPSTKDTD